MINRKFKTSKY